MTLSKQSHKGGSRRQRHHTSFVKSCTAITWASLLFSVSGVTGFSSPGRRTVNSKSRSEFCSPGFLPERIFSPLPRKDSSGHLAMFNSVQSRIQDSSSPVALASSSMTRSRLATRLNYSNGNEQEPRSQQESAAIEDLQDKEAARWWQSVFSSDNAPPPKQDEEQQVVDEYLEFLDKRYKRLHEKEKKRPQPAPKKFSALGWLTADKSEPVSQQEENALYVLGVAELASERLLQKHHASLQYKRKTPQEIEKQNEVVIDAIAVEDTAEDTAIVDRNDESIQGARATLLFATLAQAGRKVLKGVSNRRKALIIYQEKKIVAAMLIAFKTALEAPVMATKLLWNLGGGRKTVGLTVSAFITAFLVVRPVAQTVVSETTNFTA